MDRPISIITEESIGTLWLGGLAGARDIGLLKDYSIGIVITAAKGITIQYPKEIKYIKLNIAGNPDFPIIDYFKSTAEIISKSLENSSVLIHCHTGFTRSAVLVVAYLMIKNRWTALKSIDYLIERRPIALKEHYLFQLLQFETQLQNENSQKLQGTLRFPENISTINQIEEYSTFSSIIHPSSTKFDDGQNKQKNRQKKVSERQDELVSLDLIP